MGSYCLMGTVSVWEVENILEIMVTVHNNMNVLNATKFYTYKWLKW